MFDRFTQRAKKVIIYAQDEARAMGHSYIGSEHLLLGLAKEGEGAAAKTLKTMSISLTEIRKQVKDIVGIQKPITDDKVNISFTPKAKLVLEAAMKEMVELGKTYVGTEHILLGILNEKNTVATQIIESIGSTTESIKKTILQQIGVEGENEKDADEGISKNPFGPGSDEQDGDGGSKDPRPNIFGNRTRPKRRSALEQFAENMTEQAKANKYDPIVGRDDIITRVVQVLSRRKKNNPVLLGEAGVGKTAILEGIAQKIVKNEVPGTLAHKTLYSIDITAILAGTHYRGDFEVRMKAIISEVKERDDVILFFDEIHMMVGAGAVQGGSIDAGNILKPLLASGDIRIIGATTYDEYRENFEKDTALERRFQPIQINEPSVKYTIEILDGLKKKYEEYHKVTIDESAIKAAARLSNRYINDRFLPDKAIDLIDEAGARMRVNNLSAPPEMNETYEELQNVKKEKDKAIDKEDFEKATELRNREAKLRDKFVSLEKEWRDGDPNGYGVVDSDLIAKLVSEQTGVPVFKMTEAESARLLRMEDELHKRVVGQNEAVSVLARSIRRTRSGLKDPKKPSGSFIFAGPTGVGKTELAKALSEYLFDTEDSLIRLDMSEYSTVADTSKLLGSAPGFVGYEDSGQLTEKVRRNPFSVILFDEIEKAHPDVFNTLLQVLDEGHLTDGHGKKIDFKNTIIIMTTNIGASEISQKSKLGFSDGDDSEATYNDMKQRVNKELRKDFRPEFLNRLDDVIVFKQLSQNEVREIADLQIAKLNKRLSNKKIVLKLTKKASEKLAEIGYEPTFGARPLLRAIQRQVEDPISEKILTKEIQDGETVKIDLKNGVKENKKNDVSLSKLYDITESLFSFTT